MPGEELTPTEQQFEPVPDSLAMVRRFVRGSLNGADVEGDVVLAASELATNVVRHARTPYAIRLSGSDLAVRLEVSDGSSIIPAVDELTSSKRGLRVIEGLSRQWGVELTENGKTIWAEFGFPS